MFGKSSPIFGGDCVCLSGRPKRLLLKDRHYVTIYAVKLGFERMVIKLIRLLQEHALARIRSYRTTLSHVVYVSSRESKTRPYFQLCPRNNS